MVKYFSLCLRVSIELSKCAQETAEVRKETRWCVVCVAGPESRLRAAVECARRPSLFLLGCKTMYSVLVLHDLEIH